MKRMFLTVAVAVVLLVACGGDNSGEPLTEPEYRATGAAICDQLDADISALRDEFTSNPSPDQDAELQDRATGYASAAIDDLLELTPPASQAFVHDQLRATNDERVGLLAQVVDGEDVFEELAAAQTRFQTQAEAIWPSCAG